MNQPGIAAWPEPLVQVMVLISCLLEMEQDSSPRGARLLDHWRPNHQVLRVPVELNLLEPQVELGLVPLLGLETTLLISTQHLVTWIDPERKTRSNLVFGRKLD